jgi:hypothetical protein
MGHIISSFNILIDRGKKDIHQKFLQNSLPILGRNAPGLRVAFLRKSEWKEYIYMEG